SGEIVRGTKPRLDVVPGDDVNQVRLACRDPGTGWSRLCRNVVVKAVVPHSGVDGQALDPPSVLHVQADVRDTAVSMYWRIPEIHGIRDAVAEAKREDIAVQLNVADVASPADVHTGSQVVASVPVAHLRHRGVDVLSFLQRVVGGIGRAVNQVLGEIQF